MADLLFLATTVAFFALAVAVVRLCDAIIGPDSEHLDADRPAEVVR
jgi:hypothetical protein